MVTRQTYTQPSTPFMSIRQAARTTGISEYQLRLMLRGKTLPGFYSGTKFNVDIPRLLDQLREPQEVQGNG